MTIILINLKKYIVAAGIMAALSLLLLGAVLAADSLPLTHQSNYETSFEAYSNQFQSRMPLENEDDYTLLEVLWSKMVDENRFFPWNNGELFEEGAYFQPRCHGI